MQKNRPVKTTQTSLELLEVIKELDGATVGELVDETGLARSTLHNHLQTLLETGYLIKEFNTYHLGLKLFQLGEYARTRKREYELAEEAVERLAVRTDMEADFNIEEYGRLINLHDMIANSSESGLDIGNYFYMHNTAAGKAMLAAYPRDRQEEIIETRGFPRETEHTITDEEELLAELETVQEQGYAVNDEECILGYKTFGKAIHYPNGRVFGGMAVGGPTYLMDTDRETSIRSELFGVADELEEEIAALFEDQ